MRIPYNRTERPDEAVTGHPAALSGLRFAGYLQREAHETVPAAAREVIARARAARISNRQLLANETDEAKRQLLARLLAERRG